MVNAPGWDLLIDGHMISAIVFMFNYYLLNTTVAILFFVYQGMLFLKTRNLTMCWVTGLIFTSMYAAAETIIKPAAVQIMFLILVFELAGILYALIWK